MIGASASARDIAAAVRTKRVSAVEAVRAALHRIQANDAAVNGFTTVTADRALARAADIDRVIASGGDPGPLAGAPFAVKNLFDVKGLPTLAGSKINRDRTPATRDAALVERLEAAGAVLVGALNMDEYAYGFTTENSHYGPCRNPHDTTRLAGGSSGGSAVAVAAGLVPLTLGSDTNGSIRVPSSLCGIFGLKPTYGRLTRTGSYLFASSFDHLGPFARSVGDIAAAYDTMQGPDPEDPACSTPAADPVLPKLAEGAGGLRVAVADGWFRKGLSDEGQAAMAAVAGALGATRSVTIPEAQRARAAAFLITMAEGANLHLPDLKTRATDFDPMTRDRFLAGALVPAHWVLQAQRLRRWYRARVLELFQTVDVILAPATPVVAPPIGTEFFELDGERLPVRANMGLYTQPLSFIGLPILAVPVHRPGSLPIGVQVIAAPWREDLVLRVGAALEAAGVVSAPVAKAFADA
ncbi:AtzE family amidohydrolase [Azospirillum sp. RWY-5-1]|uniref:AtzE family amidohydrolase n=1 Tax=Azospirillum oleiclasticum TaxID=2735135 RepID=A0ABX2T2I1_9PROT|nr:AtzE family amidohydrolase [Azospirillum oleiclasticum]NYZ11345.1 AtzE family amidohydrolase [Azospirillum oleiclasticum]NYZ18506.1 AtzE family amidohydrolase [Azospirillum oleiclasticum]